MEKDLSKEHQSEPQTCCCGAGQAPAEDGTAACCEEDGPQTCCGGNAAGDCCKQGEGESCCRNGEISELLRKMDELLAETNLHRERYLRAIADLENFRKRSVREKDDARRAAVAGIMEDLLPVLDNFSLGLQSARQHEGGEPFAAGFDMILRQMSQTLADNGLEEIKPHGDAFDPNFHESLGMRVTAEHADGTVIEVHRTGYKLHGRLLRPAAVIVASAEAADVPAQEN